MPERIRVLRILEYNGTRDFVERSLRKRSVKDHMTTPEGSITEGFLGGILGYETFNVEDTPEKGDARE